MPRENSPRHSETEGVGLESVSKTFETTRAVDGVSLTIGAGEFFSLLGPSGCGNTTLLRIVAGFETPDLGRVFVHGRDVTTVPPQKRPASMVFQNYALFPSMTVGGNVEYGLRVRRVGRAERSRRVTEALARVGLQGLEDRPVTMLSGGQQQRVAVARALAVEPEVLLFDEPLSNLDVSLRQRTRAELRELQHRLRITSIYVTHDQEEALALSDRIGVMNAGRLIEAGKPRELYENPRTAFVARFLGGANVVNDERAIWQLTGQQKQAGRVLAVRPEQIIEAEDGLPVRFVHVQYLGPYLEGEAESGDLKIRVRFPPDTEVDSIKYLKARRSSWVVDESATIERPQQL